MAIRLVPFAIAGGSPKKIKTGNVNKEPPPAKVLMIPAKKNHNQQNTFKKRLHK